MIFLSTLFLSVFITIALIPLFSRVAVLVHALDMPDLRKVHLMPVPRFGGFAMALGALGPIVFLSHMTPQVSAYLAGCAILFATGIYDDFQGLGYQAKLMAQVAAALFLVLYGGVVIKNVGNLLPNGIPSRLACHNRDGVCHGRSDQCDQPGRRARRAGGGDFALDFSLYKLPGLPRGE